MSRPADQVRQSSADMVTMLHAASIDIWLISTDSSSCKDLGVEVSTAPFTTENNSRACWICPLLDSHHHVSNHVTLARTEAYLY